MKLTKEEKLKYVRQYINGERIATPDDCKNRRSFMSSLSGWAKRYKEEGEAGLERKKRRIIPLETKLETVRRIRNGERNDSVNVKLIILTNVKLTSKRLSLRQ